MTTGSVPPASLLGPLARIAMAAGAAIEQVRREAAMGLVEKPDGSPLTDADLAADLVIRAGLAEAAPGIPVVCEEGAACEDMSAPRYFLIDPLDGTREFVAGDADYTVNIALIEHGRPVAGVVFAPRDGRLWSGAEGCGATRQDGAGPARPVRVRATDGGLVAVASRSHRDAATEAFLAWLGVSETRCVGSSLKFCLVAEGGADVYPRFGPTMAWDTAAGQAVLEAAGGAVFCPEGKPFRYTPENGWRNGAFIAWGASRPPIAS
ncbi:3'(2'),5'-bisphosphate nucleotidase CysQ [Roseomonas hellenica]|uniref:3'(2'),5'-bisphosphate nucleotidase CysQ n=2 Tax=Plastoroseomonas hellenica TaxID=2687306 RepID=A0ABS5F6L4_9PROT|nr:3'(2'),5'-bisphosphate nucleotidase CysQ [Plastoroseomonas hellenica]